jgi:aspartate racemase
MAWPSSAAYYQKINQLIAKRLENSSGLQVLIPQGAQQDNVHNAFYQELVKGIVTESTRAKFRDAITDLTIRGAQTIVLGGTEFGMVVGAEDSSVPVIDTTVMHVEAAVNAPLGTRPIVLSPRAARQSIAPQINSIRHNPISLE